MRKPRIDVLYTNLALEAAYAREDTVKAIVAAADEIAMIANGHDTKAKGGKIDPTTLRNLAAKISTLAKQID